MNAGNSHSILDCSDYSELQPNNSEQNNQDS
jgi:hypothetical protein